MDALKGLPTQTKTGRSIALYANIGQEGDLPGVLENDAEGIGLFRSEFLYLRKNDYPTEEDLFEAYKEGAQAMGQRKLIIRTLDIGADKRVGVFQLAGRGKPCFRLPCHPYLPCPSGNLLYPAASHPAGIPLRKCGGHVPHDHFC